jgi:hypothetical protein
MATSKKWNGKFWIESTDGTKVDLSKHWKSATVTHADGSTEHMVSEEYLKELDDKYINILAKIIDNTK